MRVCVSGAGLAGLASASFLRRLGCVSSVTVLDKRSFGEVDSIMAAKSVGLWTPAIDCLDELGVSKSLLREAAFVKASGYRGYEKGQWLMQPKVGTVPYIRGESKASLGFFNNADVLHALHKSGTISYNNGTAAACHVTFCFEETVDNVDVSKSILHTSTGRSIDCDLLVAADGSHSAIYQLLHGEGRATQRLKYRGYDVYRGTADLPADMDSFQTWGPGARFAMVPLGHTSSSAEAAINSSSSSSKQGQNKSSSSKKSSFQHKNNRKVNKKQRTHSDGSSAGSSNSSGNHDTNHTSRYSWFAAITGKESGPQSMVESSVLKPATNAQPNQDNKDDTEEEGKQQTDFGDSDALSALSGPFANRSYKAPKTLVQEVKSFFSTWHDPITRAISSSQRQKEDVIVTPAWASADVEKELSKVYYASDLPGSSGDDADKNSKQGMAVAFCGDAFHTFDPILAIGAGTALEQARGLSRSIEMHAANATAIGGGGGGGGEPCTSSVLAEALKDYNAKICKRAQVLSAISDMVQRVTHVESGLMNVYRDTLLFLLPKTAKGKLMDAAIAIVANVATKKKDNGDGIVKS